MSQLTRREARRGTFASGAPKFTETLNMDGTLSELVATGVATSSRLVALEEVAVTPQHAKLLGIEPGTPAVRTCRVRYFNDQPCRHIISTLPKRIGKMISDPDLTGRLWHGRTLPDRYLRFP